MNLARIQESSQLVRALCISSRAKNITLLQSESHVSGTCLHIDQVMRSNFHQAANLLACGIGRQNSVCLCFHKSLRNLVRGSRGWPVG